VQYVAAGFVGQLPPSLHLCKLGFDLFSRQFTQAARFLDEAPHILWRLRHRHDGSARLAIDQGPSCFEQEDQQQVRLRHRSPAAFILEQIDGLGGRRRRPGPRR
jgi:hypothetical protein